LSEPSRPRTFLLDGTALIYRAHFAFLRNPLITTRGEEVSAVFGLISTVFRILREEKPTRLLVAFDRGEPTFRHEQYADYKAHRPPMPDALISQGPRTREVLTTLGARLIEQAGIEADDWIGTYARAAARAGDDVVIVSSDKDLMQLVGSRVRQWIPPKANEPGQWIDADAVRARWGVGPEQMIDFLALMGDASDNVPGVAGVGEKTAAKLLQTFGSFDAIYERLEEVLPVTLREKLRRGREDALLSRELVTVKCDLPLPYSLDDLAAPQLRATPELRALLEQLEFRRLLAVLAPSPDPAPVVGQLDFSPAIAPESNIETPPDPNAGPLWGPGYRTLATLEELDAYLAAFRASGAPLAFDTETTSLDARRAELVGLSLSFAPGDAVYVPVGHRDGPNAPLDGVLERLRAVFADPGVLLVGQNCKYDLHLLAARGIDRVGPVRDTMLASYLLDPEGSHGLDALSQEILGHRMIPITELIGEGRTQITMDQVAVDRATEYAAEDADAAGRLHPIFEERLRAAELHELWTELECPLIDVLLTMERAGIGLDVEYLAVLSRELERRLAALTLEIHAAAEREFNIASPAQLAQVLFDHLRLPKGKKTKTGYSTDQEVLEELASLHPVPRLVLEHRQLSKLKGTYVDSLPALVDPQTKRLHTTYGQAVAATGRLSSNDPNLQNIPIRSAAGREIRRAFVAAPGHRLICADYSQIELRILAHLSGDETLREAFRQGQDIHVATAVRLFGVDPSHVDAELRSRAKTVNFGVIYGMGPIRLARALSIPVAEARRFIGEYFARIPGVKLYLEASLAEARQNGYVRTLYGRRRIVRGLDGRDPRLKAQAERIVGNTPIQGTAADLIKRAMLRVHAALRERRVSARLLLQVHDELVLEAPHAEVEEVRELVREAMEQAGDLSVPLRVDFGAGDDWSEAHP